MDIEQPEEHGTPPKPNPRKSPLTFLTDSIKGLAKKPRLLRKIFIVAGGVIVFLIVRSIFFPPARNVKDKKQDSKASEEDLVPVKVFKVGRFNFESCFLSFTFLA